MVRVITISIVARIHLSCCSIVYITRRKDQVRGVGAPSPLGYIYDAKYLRASRRVHVGPSLVLTLSAT